MNNLLEKITYYLEQINILDSSLDFVDLEKERQFFEKMNLREKDFSSNFKMLFLALLCLNKKENKSFSELEEFVNLFDEEFFSEKYFCKQKMMLKILQFFPKSVVNVFIKGIKRLKKFRKKGKENLSLIDFVSFYEQYEEVFTEYVCYQKEMRRASFIEFFETYWKAWKKKNFSVGALYISLVDCAWEKKKANLNATIQEYYSVSYKIKEHFLSLEEKVNKQKERKRNQIKIKKLLLNLQKECISVKEGEYFYFKPCYIYKLPLEILEPLFECVLNYNTEVYRTLNFKSEKKSYYLNRLLEQYRISNTFTEEETIEYITKDLQEIESVLKGLKNLNIAFSFSNKDLATILECATYESLQVLKKGIDFSFLSSAFLIQNIEFFNEKHSVLLEQNITYLLENHLKIKNGDGLLFDPSFILGIQLALQYSLDVEDQTILKHIIDPFFFDFLDHLIEMQYFVYFKENSLLFNENLPVLIKKLQIAYRLKLNLLNPDGKLDIHQLKQIKIPENKLDSYIFDATPYFVLEEHKKILDADLRLQFEELDYLKEYEENKLVYRINNLCVSKNRILRNAFVLPDKKDLLSCISYHSFFNKDELLLLQMELESRGVALMRNLK